MYKGTVEDIKVACAVIGIIFAMGGLVYLVAQSDPPVKTTGKVIGTFVEPSGFSARTICVVDVDGERYNTANQCNSLVGDIVKVNKYKHYVSIIRG